MFIDKVSIKLSSGKGGAGAVSWRREKFVPLGGPDGGAGGRGGDVILKVDNNSHTLANFRGVKHLKAENGKNGMPKNATGRSGQNLIVSIPPGTQVFDLETDELLYDLVENGDEVLFLKGGKGGLGNSSFKSSRNQQPKKSQPGIPSESKEVRLEMKLISDIALVGFPNTGKSTLISTISNARPEIANYEFTTLTPKLGTVVIDYDKSFVIADIPGLIEGASDGKGLGIEFLTHIERSEFLLFMLDISNYRETKEQYDKLRIEIERFSETLSKRDFAIALTKIDTISDETFNIDELVNQFTELGAKFVLPISSVSGKNIDQLKFKLWEAIN
ncbi:Obg family GTPase CgtA [Thiovulum sp. ES]|nr:Obg family GTPase CgtA [Thiovulum sp. ES]